MTRKAVEILREEQKHHINSSRGGDNYDNGMYNGIQLAIDTIQKLDAVTEP